MEAKKIAVTGGLSSGKSTVCRLFAELGAYVVDADKIVHKLLTLKTGVGRQVVDLFGDDVLTAGQIDRSKVANKAFVDPTLLQALEDLLHPTVYHEIECEYQHVKSSYRLFIAEIPLLFETGAEQFFTATIVVKAKPKTCVERFKSKSKSPSAEYEKRMARQMSMPEKAARASYVIDNDGSLEELKKTVVRLYGLLSSP